MLCKSLYRQVSVYINGDHISVQPIKSLIKHYLSSIIGTVVGQTKVTLRQAAGSNTGALAKIRVKKKCYICIEESVFVKNTAHPSCLMRLSVDWLSGCTIYPFRIDITMCICAVVT